MMVSTHKELLHKWERGGASAMSANELNQLIDFQVDAELHLTLDVCEAERERDELNDGYQRTGLESNGCPGCQYEKGVFIEQCELHRQIDEGREALGIVARVQEQNKYLQCENGIFEREAQHLHAIIAKLPMCWQLDVDGDDRELRQTCPVVPNMRLWIVTDSEIGNGRVVSLNKELISLTNGWVQHPDAYYNSLAAAEFAQQEAAANQQEKP